MLPVAEPIPRPLPAAAAGDPRVSRWEVALAVALGAALLAFGWFDTRAYLTSLHKFPLTFALTARPGGVRVGESLEFFRRSDKEYVRLENFSALENEWDHAFRHGLGPVSTVEIFTGKSHGRMGIRIENRLVDQDIVIVCNGQVVEHIAHAKEGQIAHLYPLNLHPGSNVVTFTYGRYNNDGTHPTPGDSRTIGVTFDALDLVLE